MYHQQFSGQAAPSYQATPRLDDRDEMYAQRIKKLLFGISFHESKNNSVAFENSKRELMQIGNDIQSQGGRERLSMIENRVETLCGGNFDGLSQYLYYVRNPNQ